MKASIVVLLIGASTASQCGKNNEVNLACVKGKYLGIYCEGAVIQILDNVPIGKNWKSPFTSKNYQNCVVASLDTTIFKGTGNYPSVLARSTDSTFYFKYKDGGYSRKEYNLCEPSAFITITGVSETTCP